MGQVLGHKAESANARPQLQSPALTSPLRRSPWVARHMREDTSTEEVLVRMTRVMMHAFRRHEETWPQWHLRTCKDARDARAWGHHPGVSITAPAVVGARICVARPTTSVRGCALRWRSTVDVSAMLSLVGQRLGTGSRRRRGRARLRREGPWAFVAGEGWWATADSWDPRRVACLVAHAAARCDGAPLGAWRPTTSALRARRRTAIVVRVRPFASHHSRRVPAEDAA